MWHRSPARSICVDALPLACLLLLACRYDSKPQHATAGPSGALLLVTSYRGAADSSGSPDQAMTGAVSSHAAGRASSGQQQQQQDGRGYTCVASRQLLERTVAPAVEPDQEDV
jgi:hypothetical protein